MSYYSDSDGSDDSGYQSSRNSNGSSDSEFDNEYGSEGDTVCDGVTIGRILHPLLKKVMDEYPGYTGEVAEPYENLGDSVRREGTPFLSITTDSLERENSVRFDFIIYIKLLSYIGEDQWKQHIDYEFHYINRDIYGKDKFSNIPITITLEENLYFILDIPENLRGIINDRSLSKEEFLCRILQPTITPFNGGKRRNRRTKKRRHSRKRPRITKRRYRRRRR
jgi:hypothetical protein